MMMWPCAGLSVILYLKANPIHESSILYQTWRWSRPHNGSKYFPWLGSLMKNVNIIDLKDPDKETLCSLNITTLGDQLRIKCLGKNFPYLMLQLL